MFISRRKNTLRGINIPKFQLWIVIVIKNKILRHKFFVLSPRQLVWAHVVLQMLDWITTLFITANVSINVESNPIIRLILEGANGMWWFTAAKLAMCGLIMWIIPKSLRISPNHAWVWRALAILYIAIVLNNLVGVAIVCMLF